MALDLGKDAACCSKGDSWEGDPTGSTVKIGDLNTYLAKPPQPTSRAVLLVSGRSSSTFGMHVRVFLLL